MMEQTPIGGALYTARRRKKPLLFRERPVAVFDFDGTLAPIVEQPADARISRQAKKRLAQLASFARVIILTGRQRSFVEAQVRSIQGVKVIGLYGNERMQKGAALQSLEILARAIADKTSGMHTEAKPSGFTLHYRNSGKTDAQARKILSPLLRKAKGIARIAQGRRALEFLPKGAKTKKETLFGIVLRSPQSRVVFVGDDHSDCEAILACSHFRNFTGALVRSREMQCKRVKKIRRGRIFAFAISALLEG